MKGFLASCKMRNLTASQKWLNSWHLVRPEFSSGLTSTFGKEVVRRYGITNALLIQTYEIRAEPNSRHPPQDFWQLAAF